MRDALTLVRGAVGKKDLVPVLTHFHFYAGRVQGGNGRVTIDAPCPDLDIPECTVPAERFLKAFDACDGEPQLTLTEGGRLTVKRGKFRALLPLAEHSSFPRISRGDAQAHPVSGLLGVCARLRGFVGNDATRPWSCGVLFRDGLAWATNNVSLARTAAAFPVDDTIVPVHAIDELLRIGHQPLAVTVTDNAVTFVLPGDVWITAHKFDGAWPDVSSFIVPAPCALAADELRRAVETVLPFCPDPKYPVIMTGPDGVSTLDGSMSATVALGTLPETRFHATPLLTVLAAATSVDLSAYPAPCYWSGDGVDGVVIGVRA